MKRKRGPAAPPNRAARALADAINRQRVIGNRKAYCRTIKHRNRDRDPGSAVSGLRSGASGRDRSPETTASA